MPQRKATYRPTVVPHRRTVELDACGDVSHALTMRYAIMAWSCKTLCAVSTPFGRSAGRWKVRVSAFFRQSGPGAPQVPHRISLPSLRSFGDSEFRLPHSGEASSRPSWAMSSVLRPSASLLLLKRSSPGMRRNAAVVRLVGSSDPSWILSKRPRPHRSPRNVSTHGHTFIVISSRRSSEPCYQRRLDRGKAAGIDPWWRYMTV